MTHTQLSESAPATSRTRKAVVEKKRSLDYRNCLGVRLQQPQPFE
ncbi:hypothetical protein [Nostoc sp. CCY 9925]